MSTKKFWQVPPHQRHLQVIGASTALGLIFLAACVLVLALDGLAIFDFWGDMVSIALTLAISALGMETFVLIYGRRELHGREAILATAQEAKRQTEALFAMTDMLQSADNHDDATEVLKATAQRLLPEFGAALYVFNNSRDRLDLAGSWNTPDDFHVAATLAIGNCWALKRGKPHINDPASDTLRCNHHHSQISTVEIPMMARGSVYGLLVLAYGGDDAFERLKGIRRLGRALADSMSLAVSNIALREKLLTQSLRDPLTGLYNRRYMEDALERYLSLAERNGVATSVLMIDLDNFKLINDEHGHAKGDAVLRDVAAQIVGGLRPSDVVCRYGGEELMVILPSCPMEDAASKAEQLRARIESLSEMHQAQISASIGIASVPTTSTSASDIVAHADAALFEAKRQGKNRVVCAERRAGREDAMPRLAATG